MVAVGQQKVVGVARDPVIPMDIDRTVEEGVMAAITMLGMMADGGMPATAVMLAEEDVHQEAAKVEGRTAPVEGSKITTTRVDMIGIGIEARAVFDMVTSIVTVVVCKMVGMPMAAKENTAAALNRSHPLSSGLVVCQRTSLNMRLRGCALDRDP